MHYDAPHFRMAGAISSGEGRNVTVDNAGGYDYTGRLEWLPFGKFSGDSEYSASDLKREQDVKVMFGLTYDYNDHASRERGQLGNFLTDQRTLKTLFLDMHMKYRGLSMMVEYADKKSSDTPVILDDTGVYLESFFVGTGINAQAGYLFKNNFEIAGRYTQVDPNAETQKTLNEQYTFGVSKYFVGHSLKIQSDATYITEVGASDQFMYRFQIELSF